MKEIRTITIVIMGLLILTSFVVRNNEKIMFHKIEFTDSSIKLLEWNITDTSKTAFLQEIVDDLGRTNELRFYSTNHKLYYTGSGFYGGPIIKYEYLDNKIIETFFNSDGEIANDFSTSEVPYKHIYYLDEFNQIVDIKMVYKIDFEWTKESFEKTIEHLEYYKTYPDEGSKLKKIFGFTYAYAKMNGIDPSIK